MINKLSMQSTITLLAIFLTLTMAFMSRTGEFYLGSLPNQLYWFLTFLFWSWFSCIPTIGKVEAFNCYQCESNKNIECSEIFDEANTKLRPEPCDHVFEARYCVKTTGMYEGQIGTKRFCSARDMGSYCEYVKRQSDDRPYRSCVFTCYGQGCNPASPTTTAHSFLITVMIAIVPMITAIKFLLLQWTLISHNDENFWPIKI